MQVDSSPDILTFSKLINYSLLTLNCIICIDQLKNSGFKTLSHHLLTEYPMNTCKHWIGPDAEFQLHISKYAGCSITLALRFSSKVYGSICYLGVLRLKMLCAQNVILIHTDHQIWNTIAQIGKINYIGEGCCRTWWHELTQVNSWWHILRQVKPIGENQIKAGNTALVHYLGPKSVF